MYYLGYKLTSHSRELLCWGLLKSLKLQPLLHSQKYMYEADRVFVWKTLVRDEKNHSSVMLQDVIFRSWDSTARYCAKRLRPTTNVLAIHKEKIVFRRFNHSQLTGLRGDPKPSFSITESPTCREIQSEFGDSEADTERSGFDVLTRNGREDLTDESSSLVCTHMKRPSSSFTGDILDHKPGWPLLRVASIDSPKALQSKQLSAVQWVMNLPNRSSLRRPRSLGRLLEMNNRISLSGVGESERDMEILLKTNSSTCKWFSYEILKAATSDFFSGNLIGKGGCNRVKTQKSSQAAIKNFAREVDIISSLKHRHISPLLGICLVDTELISVYDLLSKGSLEENLHGFGENKDNSQLMSWELRYKIAVKIADALNFLHNECSQPVIHRDIKSSNILLSEEFEPQLSDFGLAIWAPLTSSFATQDDVVGTFGYLAPEYFMYGKVSDKIDVYAFGVVLLELLSGRRPIASSESPKNQQSLVMWAKPIIESGNARSILDPDLEGNIDEVQMQRMVLAATLCISRSASRRPKMIEILNLLREAHSVEKWMNSKDPDHSERQVEEDDEVYPNSSAELHLSLSLLDIDDDTTSLSSLEKGNHISWSRSSSFD
ncbi:hypothetical protein K2173_012433 [Erythroxylum novogranatense]|uniref:Protein kinase domain-containing protein n=1 Tax=Erythroxylum novogranatense TaxID=1862640 RepID=A0AAV8TL42_9ROSI|nr:hypothetical protein K2173_012433 [Erythroxylum novogranatense]